MSKVKSINTPLNTDTITGLQCGDQVEITGYIYTARDAAHKRLVEMIKNNEDLPMEMKGRVIYYAGPCPAKPGQAIGSVGPTTSYRMDDYAPELIKLGLAGMIGKGTRGQNVIDHMKKYKSVYFAAVGGAGALISKCVKEQEIIAFEDLGTEAIRKLYVEKFPAIVVIDSSGQNMYDSI